MSDAKPRILGLDIGDARIGVAISDPLHLTAAGIVAVHRVNMAKDLEAIRKIAEENEAVEIVIGFPFNMDGSAGSQAEKVKSFGRKLERKTRLTITYQDERLTTFGAINDLVEVGIKTGQNRDLVDIQSAAIILQRYLDKKEERPPSV
ncbi:MAG: Holliday junction resolvase RuvX [Leptolyngbya sp.]|nr:Holliday junction resolvase RuvX [Candidatus Melainabacteria bacterium]